MRHLVLLACFILPLAFGDPLDDFFSVLDNPGNTVYSSDVHHDARKRFSLFGVTGGCPGENMPQWNGAQHLLISQMNAQIMDFTRAREAEIQKYSTRAEWQARQARMKPIVKEALIGDNVRPKDPLNVQSMGIIKGPGYQIEKLVFQT